MKKVGILTRRAGYNHGSSLQAYAMMKFIGDAGYDCTLIDYDEYSGHPQWKIRPFAENIEWTFLRPFLRWLSPTKYRYLQIRYWQYNRFSAFEKKYYNLTARQCSSKKVLRQVASDFDALVCGSDQIWCPLLYDPVFLFGFLKDGEAHSVAYAPSIGIPNIDLIKEKERKLMRRIEHLSCREQMGADMIKEITGKECPVVLDPTLMVEAAHWSEMADSIQKVESGSYILCYFLGKNVHQEYIDKLSNLSGCKILNILMFNRMNNLRCDRTITDVGPIEFLNLIKNADFVCTDSFHGTIFSLQFGKRLSLFERFKAIEKENQNSRIYTLLKNLHCEEVLVRDGDKPCLDSSFDKVAFRSALQMEREKSLNYIKKALG